LTRDPDAAGQQFFYEETAMTRIGAERPFCIVLAHDRADSVFLIVAGCNDVSDELRASISCRA
jgi:hypothetical protein